MTIHEHLVDVLCRHAGLDPQAAHAVTVALAQGRRMHRKTSYALAQVKRCRGANPVERRGEVVSYSVPCGWIRRVMAWVKGSR
jgi:hypothetical protein